MRSCGICGVLNLNLAAAPAWTRSRPSGPHTPPTCLLLDMLLSCAAMQSYVPTPILSTGVSITCVRPRCNIPSQIPYRLLHSDAVTDTFRTHTRRFLRATHMQKPAFVPVCKLSSDNLGRRLMRALSDVLLLLHPTPYFIGTPFPM